MSERFFVQRPIAGSRVELAGGEARHLAAVMRAQPGDEARLFDGSGAEFACRVTAVHKQRVELEVIERLELSRELPFALTLAVALPKGERQKWLVEKATELGVTLLIPLLTERGVAQPTAGALDRLRRSVVEASKQCGRNRLLEIAEPRQASEFFLAASPGEVRLLADPAGTPLPPGGAGSNVTIAIGPEGGFTDSEVAAARSAGWQSAALGPRILRVETAAIALAAWAGMRAP
ncbi:MAG: RsmE family RNA methyltransferase [Pirellulaceae bacterium]